MYRSREEKKELRKAYLEKRLSMDPALKKTMDERICNTLAGLVSYRYADNVLMYYPTKGEIDVLPLLENALKVGKRVALPRCDESGLPKMDYYFIEKTEDLENGVFGIPCPKTDLPVYSPETKGTTIVLIPALAYDKKGYRLGYGKGYYDRYVDKSKMTTIGLTYSDFLVDELPRGRFDVSVHFVVTDKGVKLIDQT